MHLRGWMVKSSQRKNMKSRLEITTENDGRYTTQSEGADWKGMLINLINSVSTLKNESGYIRSRLKIETDRGNTIMEAEGSGWAEVLIRFMNGFSTGTKIQLEKVGSDDRVSESLSVRERLEAFLKFDYPHVWFTSMDVKKQYDRAYDHINLSTVSTYLARMYSQNKLERRGSRTQREYRLAESEIPEQTLAIMQNVN
jgi:hypothetical protein